MDDDMLAAEEAYARDEAEAEDPFIAFEEALRRDEAES